MDLSSSIRPSASPVTQTNQKLVGLVMSLFFSFGFCTVLVDSIIPKLKGLFSLSYTEVMLTQFCFFGAYFIISMPASWLIARLGYLQAVVTGLVLMALGCLLFTPAANLGLYPAFLGALFILASGVTIVQVAANPLAAEAGNPATASSRLTLAQAFNSVATMVGPYFGAYFFLRSGVTIPNVAALSPAALAQARQTQAHVFQLPFVGIAVFVLVIAAICFLVRHWAPEPRHNLDASSQHKLFANPRLMLGILSIFTYVGAEVSIGSTMANYLMQPTTLGAVAETAGKMVSLYWGGAMCGRFVGSYILARARPGFVLVGCATGAAALALTSSFSTGSIAAYTALAIGLCNSIMFPTVFTLAIEGLGDLAGSASGLLCLGIVGGAIVPMITGAVADHTSLARALLVPVVCYIWLGTYGFLTGKKILRAGDAIYLIEPAEAGLARQLPPPPVQSP